MDAFRVPLKTRLQRHLTWLLTVVMVISLVSIAAPQQAPATTIPSAMGAGNPFTNGDIFWSNSLGCYQLNVTWQTHVTQIGYFDPPSWDVTQYKGYLSALSGVTESEISWGLSDFDVSPISGTYLNNTSIPLSSVPTFQFRTHCIEHQNETSDASYIRNAMLMCVSNQTDSAPVSPHTAVAAPTISTPEYDYWTLTFLLAFSERNDDQASTGIERIVMTWVQPKLGDLRITKTSMDSSATDGNSNYSLDGAVFGVYSDNACTARVTSVTLSGDGSSATGTATDLAASAYYVKETRAPQGYKLDTTVYPVIVTPGSTTMVNGPGGVSDQPLYAWIDLQKQSGNPAISDGNACYKLNGAVYTVYSDSGATQKATTITTDATGYGKSVADDLPAGKYWVRESKPAIGYALDPTLYAVTATPGDTVRVNTTGTGIVKDLPQNNPVKVLLSKVDAETSKSLPLGSALLTGAQFEVKYFDGYYTAANLPATPLRTWVIQTGSDGVALLNKNSAVGGDILYSSSTGTATLPLGTVSIQEIKAPTGYLLGDRPIFIRQVTSEGAVESVSTYNAPTAPEQVKRGDLELLKAAAVSYQRMAGVPFRITSTTTGENHVIVTDANGHADTSTAWNPHSQNTNTGETADDGVWFGIDKEGNKAPVSDALGALPYDTYRIEELSCGANTDYQLIAPFEVTISRDVYVVDLGTLTDSAPVIPEISTQALDADSGTQNVIAGKGATLKDTVEYQGLEAGRTYAIEGTLMDQSTTTTLTIAGQPVTASATFTPKTSQGTTEVTFNFDASALDDARIVIFESLRLGTLVVARHADISNGSQTVRVVRPRIRTTATAQNSDAKTAPAANQVTITDTVLYSDLIAGKTYVMCGTLMDKHTGKPVIIQGKKVTATRTFTPNASSGSIEMGFTFDARKLGGHDVVVFETVKQEGVEVAVHADLDDAGQTVRILAPKPKFASAPLSAPTSPTTAPSVTPKAPPVPSTGDAANAFIPLTLLLALGGVVLTARKKWLVR